MQPLLSSSERVIAALRAAPEAGLLFEDVRRVSGFVGTNDALELLLGKLRRDRCARLMAGRWRASPQCDAVVAAPEVVVAPEVVAVVPVVVSADVSGAVSVVMGVAGSVDALVAAECERLTRMIDWHLQQVDELQRYRESLLMPFGGA